MATRLIKTTLAHRGYSLVKIAYPLFGLAFLDLFASSSWFDTDISWLGIPLIVAVLTASHIFLLFLQTDRAAKLFVFFKRGKPAAVYQNWLEINQPDETNLKNSADTTGLEALSVGQQCDDTSIRFGLKRLRLACVDELQLTFWGNLIFKSRVISGSIKVDGGETTAADEVFKLPFGVVSSREQKYFIQLVRSIRPDVVLGKRIEKRLSAKLIRGEDYIQALGAGFLVFVLFDLSHSLCDYLEMLKHYHLAQVVARQELPSQAVREQRLKDARVEFDKAEHKLESSPGISLVRRTILHRGFATAAVYQSRAEALWHSGDKNEAIKSLKTALEFHPKSLRMHLELARWLALSGSEKEARKLLRKLSDDHEDALLPRLYLIVLTEKSGDLQKARLFYEIYSDKLDQEVFGNEPWWPPGGNRYLNDSWSRDDLRYLLDALVLEKK